MQRSKEVKPGTVTKLVYLFPDETIETEFRDDIAWNVGVRTLRDKIVSSLRSVERRIDRPTRIMLADYTSGDVDPTKYNWYLVVYYGSDPRFQMPRHKITEIR